MKVEINNRNIFYVNEPIVHYTIYFHNSNTHYCIYCNTVYIYEEMAAKNEQYQIIHNVLRDDIETVQELRNYAKKIINEAIYRYVYKNKCTKIPIKIQH